MKKIIASWQAFPTERPTIALRARIQLPPPSPLYAGHAGYEKARSKLIVNCKRLIKINKTQEAPGAPEDRGREGYDRRERTKRFLALRRSKSRASALDRNVSLSKFATVVNLP